MEKKVYCFKSTHNFYKECEEVVKSNAKSVVQGQVYANQFKVEEWAIDGNYFLISKEDYDKLNRKDKKLFITEKGSNWCKLKNSEIIKYYADENNRGKSIMIKDALAKLKEELPKSINFSDFQKLVESHIL